MGQTSSSSCSSHDISFSISSSTTYDLTLCLPDECLATVFAKLTCRDRNSCSLVCKRWKNVDSKSRTHLVLLARSEISPSLPSLLSRFSSVSLLSLKCSRKLPAVDDGAFSSIPTSLPTLKKLKLKGCIHISDSALHAFSLHRPHFLTKLSFASCGFGAAGLRALLTNCPALKDLTLKRLRKLDDHTTTSSASSSPIWVSSGCHHPLERLCVKDIHNARLFIPLISASSNSFKTLIVSRSSGNWDRVFKESLNGKITNISEIQMESIQLGDAGLISISSSCPQLHLLYLSRTTDCTDEGLSAIAKSCKLLKKLHIDEGGSRFGSRGIGDGGVMEISTKSSFLQEIVLMGVPITMASLNALAVNCKGLERMALCNTDTVGDSELGFIAAKLCALKKLCIKNCPISGCGIEAIGEGCPNLVKLKVKRCRGISEGSVLKLRMRRRSVVVSVDAGSMLFDGEGSVDAEEEEAEAALSIGRNRNRNPRNRRNSTTTTTTTTTTTHIICSSRGAHLLRSKFGRGRPQIQQSTTIPTFPRHSSSPQTCAT